MDGSQKSQDSLSEEGCEVTTNSSGEKIKTYRVTGVKESWYKGLTKMTFKG